MARIKAETHYKAKIVNGQRVKVAMTSREIKKYIMETHGWTAEQYRKQYDLFKNKLRAYESVQESTGEKITRQSVVDVLYREAKAMRRYGAEYQPSLKMQRIKAMSAYSITKGRKMAKSQKFVERQQEKYERYIDMDFGNMIAWARKSPTNIAKQIVTLVDEGENPIKIHQGLCALGTEYEKVRREHSKEIGEVVGSDDSDMYFDIAPYLGK